MHAEFGKLFYESNILHITSYFYEEVIYYSYILLYQKSNSVILLLLPKVIAECLSHEAHNLEGAKVPTVEYAVCIYIYLFIYFLFISLSGYTVVNDSLQS